MGKSAQEQPHRRATGADIRRQGGPRGSLTVRKKRYGAREYEYHCLKYRDGAKVISRHVAAGDVEDLSAQLELRRRYEKELRGLRKRIAYLEKLLGVGKA